MRCRLFLLLHVFLAFVSCAPVSRLPTLPIGEVEAEQRRQQIAQLRSYFTQLNRLHNVAFRLRVANRDDCKNWSWAQIGLYAATASGLPHRYRPYSHDALSVSWTRATVLSVAEMSPAATAGIRPGDRILTFNNEAVPRRGTAGWIAGFVRNNGERPIQVLVRRDGVDRIHTVVPVIACAIPIELQVDSSVNAFTTDDGIAISSSILRVALTDAQLALIVGHELAHANLGHVYKRRANTIIGWLGGAVADASITLGGIPTWGVFSRVFSQVGARAFSVAFEREADYVGAYYAARAGYDLAGSEEIWRMLSLEDPESIRVATDHPITPVRFVQLQKAIDEIEDKKRRNLPLLPQRRFVHTDIETTEAAAGHLQ
ncbi:MAG TPA: M48 family metallopeptidase [Pseudolabrys sp.]|nr:M48 family metallopeptidase [Pseudolabrys sp.]